MHPWWRIFLAIRNALNKTSYENAEQLQVYTLDNAIYMNVKNDVSFLVHSELSLFEQQSSYNPNMPLRDLIYITRQLEKYVRFAVSKEAAEEHWKNFSKVFPK